MLVPVHQIATFAGDPFQTNPAYVVTLDGPRPAGLLQQNYRTLGESMIAVLKIRGGDIVLNCVTPPHTPSLRRLARLRGNVPSLAALRRVTKFSSAGPASGGCPISSPCSAR